jgi:transcriptional regulator of acetoin/glycerol metabolism
MWFHPNTGSCITKENKKMFSTPLNPVTSVVSVKAAHNHRPVAKAIHALGQSTNAKWVPINKSFITLTKVIMRAAMEKYGLVNIAITLRCVTQQGYRHLILVNDNEDIQIAAIGRVEEFIITTEMPMTPASERLNTAEAVTFSVDFEQQRLGYLVALEADDPERSANANTDTVDRSATLLNLSALADEIIGIIRRYQTRYRAIYVYGDQCYWIGTSPALMRLDQQLGQLAQSTKPILVRGNKGTGKIIAARALHCERYTEMVPFIESGCHEWEEGAAASILQALYIYAKGGTLFLRNIDKLSPANLQALQQFWFVTFADAAQREPADSVSLIVSVSQCDNSCSSNLAQWLDVNVLELQLPELAERKEDVRDLVRFFLAEYASNDFDFHEDAWTLLEHFPWRDNVDQLKRVVQHIAAVADTTPVCADGLEQFIRTLPRVC